MSARLSAFVAALALAGGGGAACDRRLPPEGHIELFIDTDAPIQSHLDPTPAGWLFDRLEIWVLPPGADVACTGCGHAFSIDAETMRAGEASVDLVLPPHVPGYRLIVSLYRSTHAHNIYPDEESSVVGLYQLPEIDEEGTVPLTAFLPTDQTGILSWSAIFAGTASTLVPGRPTGEHVGAWLAPVSGKCVGARDEAREVCAPGGAFFMGNPSIVDVDNPEMASDHLRLVRLHPFFVDIHEVTVADYRDFVEKTHHAPPSVTSGCTYGGLATLPINCVTRDEAREYCAWRGGDLPSEAQFEYLATAMHGALYPWGDDEPECGDALFDHDRCGPFRLPDGTTSEVLPPGSGLRDRLVFPDGGHVEDLAGSLTEFVRDAWEPQGGLCWGFAIKNDPVCTSGPDPQLFSARGGNWWSPPGGLRGALRGALARTVKDSVIGFRCARSGA